MLLSFGEKRVLCCGRDFARVDAGQDRIGVLLHQHIVIAALAAAHVVETDEDNDGDDNDRDHDGPYDRVGVVGALHIEVVRRADERCARDVDVDLVRASLIIGGHKRHRVRAVVGVDDRGYDLGLRRPGVVVDHVHDNRVAARGRHISILVNGLHKEEDNTARLGGNKLVLVHRGDA